MKSRLLSIIVFIISLYLIVSFSRDLWNLSKKGGEVGKANAQLEELRLKNQELKNRLTEVQSPEFLEQQARDELDLGKPGETVLILPQSLSGVKSASENQYKDVPNWQEWWNLFF